MSYLDAQLMQLQIGYVFKSAENAGIKQLEICPSASAGAVLGHHQFPPFFSKIGHTFKMYFNCPNGFLQRAQEPPRAVQSHLLLPVAAGQAQGSYERLSNMKKLVMLTMREFVNTTASN